MIINNKSILDNLEIKYNSAILFGSYARNDYGQKSDVDILLECDKRKESFNVNIPTNLLIINKIRFSNKFVLGTGFRFLFNSNFKPYFFADAEYQLTLKITGALHVGYGGYTKLNIGLAFTYASPSWFFKLGSNSIQGYISPKNTYGQGAFISIAKKFKH